MARQTGVVAKWLNHKGIGFITPEGETEDILVHHSEIQQTTDDGFRSLEEGSSVEYDVKEDPKNAEKWVAVNVSGPEGADCVPRQRKGKGKGKGKKGKGKGKGKRDEESW